MTSDTLTLAMRFEGVLQSWGDRSRWSIRDSRPEPTKSGVIGALAACLGWGARQEDDELIARMARTLRMGVRADREGASLRDYHTIGGSRSDTETAWTGLLTATGKLKKNPTSPGLHTEVSERCYLADACYLIVVEDAPETIECIADALRSPVWPPFLGRKSCVPSAPLYPALPGDVAGTSGKLIEVLTQHPWLGRAAEQPPETLRIVVDEGDDTPNGARSLRHDVPISFRRRIFSDRYAREFMTLFPPKE
jgi:CRISPR system Cascade subunit CasD